MHRLRIQFPTLPVVALCLLLAPLGCDLFGDDDRSIDEVPPERLAAATVTDTILDQRSVTPAIRTEEALLLFDVENPLVHQVPAAADSAASRPCFGPEKRRLVFQTRSNTIRTAARLKLLDLESRSVRRLDAVGSLGGCVWRADGSGFYYVDDAEEEVTKAAFYDLTSDESYLFGRSEDRAAVFPYGRAGRDSVLVLARDRQGTDEERRLRHYFVDAETGTYLTTIENAYLKETRLLDYSDDRREFVAWFDESNAANLAVTDLDASSIQPFVASKERPSGSPKWGPDGTVLFERGGLEPNRKSTRVMSLEPETGRVRELITPEMIDGASFVMHPDY